MSHYTKKDILMNAEIISIGTELLLGEIVDTNTTHIARQLRTIGLDLYYTTSVGDNEARSASVVRQALERADVVITTGGLGPTVDDMTRQAVAQATGRPLEFRQELLEQIEARFKRWGHKMSDNNRSQAYVPQGAIALENPVGTAPCFIVESGDRAVISLPGVPREMEYLLEHEVLPYLRRRFDLRSIIKARILRTAGIGESQIDSRLGDLLTAANPTIGLAAHAGQTDVRITAKANSEQEADRLIAPVEAEVRERLGEVIYGTGKETVQEVLLRGLAQAGLTLAVAEAGTGGRLTNRLATAPGAARVFRGGQVAHDPPALGKALHIAPGGESLEHLQEFARRLAQRLTETSETGQRLGLVVLTLPRPSGDQAQDKALRQAQDKALRQAQDKATSAGGTIIALATPTGVELLRRGFGGHAALVATWASTNALELTRRWLLRHAA
jgi:nicotinamide-nucleotide amidase